MIKILYRKFTLNFLFEPWFSQLTKGSYSSEKDLEWINWSWVSSFYRKQLTTLNERLRFLFVCFSFVLLLLLFSFPLWGSCAKWKLWGKKNIKYLCLLRLPGPVCKAWHSIMVSARNIWWLWWHIYVAQRCWWAVFPSVALNVREYPKS